MRNTITLHGYLGKDQEIKEISGQNGAFLRASFTLGVSRNYGDGTDWFYCTMIGKRAEVIHKFFKKGSEILIEGSMESYKGSEGSTFWNVKVRDFDFCGKNDNRMSDQPIPEGFREVDEDEDFNLF